MDCLFFFFKIPKKLCRKRGGFSQVLKFHSSCCHKKYLQLQFHSSLYLCFYKSLNLKDSVRDEYISTFNHQLVCAQHHGSMDQCASHSTPTAQCTVRPHILASRPVCVQQHPLRLPLCRLHKLGWFHCTIGCTVFSPVFFNFSHCSSYCSVLTVYVCVIPFTLKVDGGVQLQQSFSPAAINTFLTVDACCSQSPAVQQQQSAQ